MRLFYTCGYDGKECKRYKVQLDEEGNIIQQEITCTIRDCDRCCFIGEPWARIEMK